MLNSYAFYDGSAVILILGLIGGLALFFTFLSRRRENSFSGFVRKLYDFLNFKTLLAETLLRILYLVCACTVTLSAFAALFRMAGYNFGGALLAFILLLVVGNAMLRLGFEFLLVQLIICRNSTEINAKLGGGLKTPLSLSGDSGSAPPPHHEDVPEPDTRSGHCVSCGADVPQEAAYCPNCGAKL
ncbi:MAG: zinc ribbon domain-containing protein [Oscillospiraceae bacterium]|jgi:hypothetical protein|nr:zinc ribbon domain-containing protein [Oscillospiraceae bacterium]